MLILVDHAENGLFHITNELADRGHHAGLHPLVGDVTDLGRMGDLFGRYRPEIVFMPRLTSTCLSWRRMSAKRSRTT